MSGRARSRRRTKQEEEEEEESATDVSEVETTDEDGSDSEDSDIDEENDSHPVKLSYGGQQYDVLQQCRYTHTRKLCEVVSSHCYVLRYM